MQENQEHAREWSAKLTFFFIGLKVFVGKSNQLSIFFLIFHHFCNVNPPLNLDLNQTFDE
jgi:hypothetical protein